jgi:hypothetical protein
MSHHPWGLQSIKDLRSGETFRVGRFRKEYGRLLLVVERDRSFRFVDLDGKEFTGTLEVEGSRILRMTYDEESQLRASNLTAPDLHSAPAEGPPSTFARAIDWPSVGSFRVERGMTNWGGPARPTNLLVLVSDSHEYAFFELSDRFSGQRDPWP